VKVRNRELYIYAMYSRVFEDNTCRPYRSRARRVIRGNAVSATTHPEKRRTMLNCVLKFKFNPVGKKRNGDFIGLRFYAAAVYRTRRILYNYIHI